MCGEDSYSFASVYNMYFTKEEFTEEETGRIKTLYINLNN